MTCRTEILEVIRALSIGRPEPTFTVDEVLSEMHRRGTAYRDSTIRNHVISKMCRDAPAYHATQYGDLERVSVGRYRLLAPATASSTFQAASDEGVFIPR